MKLTIDFDTTNDSLAWQEIDEETGEETRIFDHWITPCVPFKNAMRIVLTEVVQPDGGVTREWHGEICADDPLPYAQWITDSLGYKVAVLAKRPAGRLFGNGSGEYAQQQVTARLSPKR